MKKTTIVEPSKTRVTVTIDIPDPVPTLKGNVIGFTQGDPTITQTGGTAIDPVPVPIPVPDPTGSQTLKPEKLTGDLPNHGMGMCTFGTPAFTYSPKSIYDRYSWALMQTSQGTLNTTYIKSLFDKAKAAKQTVNFRIGMFDSGGGWGSTPINGIACYYPTYVHNIMQSETVKDWNNGKVWFPNWNSTGMQKAWDEFTNLLVAWLKANGYYAMIDFIDVGGYGDYEAEWHMYGFDTLEAQHGTKINDQAQIFFIDTSLQAFADIPSIGNQAMIDSRYASKDVSYHALTAKNDYGLMGFRNDHLGWTDVINADKKRMNVDYQNINFLTEYTARCNYAPMIGEPMNSVSAVTPIGGTAYQTLIDNVKDFGLCQFENVASSTVAAAQTNYINACMATGQIGISEVAIDEKRAATVTFFKTGKSVLYWPWKIVFTADGVVLKDNIIPDGVKSLSVALIDPKGYRQPFFLANKGRQADGSYKII